MKESSSYQAILTEGRREGQQQGRQEGELQALRETLLDTLSERFGLVPVELVAAISVAADTLELRAAHRMAIRVATLSDFHFPNG